MNQKPANLLFFVFLTLFVSNSYAAEIIIDTNKESFSGGDTVEITGTIPGGVEGDLAALEIKNPSGETILVRTVTLGPQGSFALTFKIPKSGESGNYEIVANAEVAGETLTESKTIMHETQLSAANSKNGGCLIATATYGSELAPQVQFLREIRDNTVLSTASGTSFMTAFNAFYYSFSPTVADLERQNPVFKEAVKLTITPMITTLSVLDYVDIDSEEELIGYGIGVILLNFGMYFVVPLFVMFKLKSRFCSFYSRRKIL
ncbi:MAG: CFI-box-CTERM domain-containing protein [Nitrosopumilaceae archaeon]